MTLPYKKKKLWRELSVDIVFLIKARHSCACFLNSFVYLFIVFGCAEALLLCGLFLVVWGGAFSLAAVRRPLVAGASLLWSPGSGACRVSRCGTRTQLLCDTWDLPTSGVKPCLLHWQGGFSTTELPGKSLYLFWKDTYTCMYTYTHTHPYMLKSLVNCLHKVFP